MSNKKIFVCGTLKHENVLHDVLTRSDFMGDAITSKPAFRLFCNGNFPYVTNVGQGGYRVIGELFKVSEKTLIELDLIEGHLNHYRRTDTEFMLVGGSMVAGQLYIYNGSTKGLNEVTSGCWFPPAFVKQKNLENQTEKV